MSELKPCPFCEKTSALDSDKNTSETFSVKCFYCGGEISSFATKELAIEAWNTRPLEDELNKQIEGQKKLIGQLGEALSIIDGYELEILDSDIPLHDALIDYKEWKEKQNG